MERKMRIILVVVATVLMHLITFSWEAKAGATVTYEVKNDTPWTIRFQAWLQPDLRQMPTEYFPAEGEVYMILPGESRSISIDTIRMERICYGAVVNGDTSKFWGVWGLNQREACGSARHGERFKVNFRRNNFTRGSGDGCDPAWGTGTC